MSLWIKSYGVTIQMKATEQYSPVVLFIMLYKVVLTFESVHEILWCDHSNETPSGNCSAALSYFFYLKVWVHGLLYFLHVFDFVNFYLNWLIQGLS